MGSERERVKGIEKGSEQGYEFFYSYHISFSLTGSTMQEVPRKRNEEERKFRSLPLETGKIGVTLLEIRSWEIGRAHV